jgi:OOP family OmpA-OmpF porin
MKQMLCAVSLAASAFAGAAHAQLIPPDAHAYIGGGLGHVDADPNKGDYSDQTPGAGTNTGTDNSTAWKLYGGLQLDKNWGVEAGYAHLGQFQNSYSLPATGSSAVGTNKLSAWSLAGTGTYPINQAFSLNAKAGVALLRSNYSFSGVGPSYLSGDSGNDHSTNLLLGVGGQYNLNKNVALRLDYENYGKIGQNTNNLTTPGTTGDVKPSMLSASLKYSF